MPLTHARISLASLCVLQLENLLFFENGFFPRLKAADLDSAAHFGEPREPKSTPYICAPEMAAHIVANGNGLLVSGAEDIWALGVLVLYLLSGQQPFAAGEGDDSTRYAPLAGLTQADVAKVIAQQATPQGQLEAFLLQCLSLPAKRGTAEELLRGGWVGGNMATEVVRQTAGKLDNILENQTEQLSMAKETHARLDIVLENQAEQLSLAKASLKMLQEQSKQLEQLQTKTAATFALMKSEAEREAELPRLVTIKSVNPRW